MICEHELHLTIPTLLLNPGTVYTEYWMCASVEVYTVEIQSVCGFAAAEKNPAAQGCLTVW